MTRVSILQFAPVLGDIDANISKVKELVTANAGSDLYVLPELASSGYNFANREQLCQVGKHQKLNVDKL